MRSSATESRFQTLENTFKSHKHYFVSLKKHLNKNQNQASNKTTEVMTNASLH